MGKGMTINQDFERAVQQMEREGKERVQRINLDSIFPPKQKRHIYKKAIFVRYFKGWKIATYKNAYGKAYAIYLPSQKVDKNRWEKLFDTLPQARFYIEHFNLFKQIECVEGMMEELI